MAGRSTFISYERIALACEDRPLPVTDVKLRGVMFYWAATEGRSGTSVLNSLSAFLSFIKLERKPSLLSSTQEVELRAWVKQLQKVYVAEKHRKLPLLLTDMERIRVQLKSEAYWDHPWAVQLWAMLCLCLSLCLCSKEYAKKKAADDYELTMDQISRVTLPSSGSGVAQRGTIAVFLPFRKANKTTLDRELDTYQVPPNSLLDGELDAAWALDRHVQLQGLTYGQVGQRVWYKLSRQRLQPSDPPRGQLLQGGETNSKLASSFKADLWWILQKAGISSSAAEANSYGLHSLRAGGATTLLAAGVPWDQVKAIGNWKSDEALEQYDRRRAMGSLAVQIGDRLSKLNLTALGRSTASTAAPGASSSSAAASGSSSSRSFAPPPASYSSSSSSSAYPQAPARK